MIPRVENHLPDLLPFIERLARDYEAGQFDDWQPMVQRVQAYFDDDHSAQFEAVLPGWRKMAGYQNAVTQIHVSFVLVSLLLNESYQQLEPDQQSLMQWVVLFHDIAKEVIDGRDPKHGFRSAAITGRTLPALGFPLKTADPAVLADWFTLTDTALIHDETIGKLIHDNRQLPAILSGIDRLFGLDSPAGLIIRVVLLHQSINALADWTQAAPLTDAEIQQYVDPTLRPFLHIMMSLDNDAWTLFDPETKQRYRDETNAVFARIAAGQPIKGD